MQEKFALRKTLKKVAAVGAGGAMMGMTMTGALALDLKDYPNGMGFGGQDTVLVVGSGAAAEDNLAATDIQGSLPQDSSSSGGTAALVEGGTDADVPLSFNIAGGSFLDTELDDGDIDVLFDGVINFNSKEYDVSERVVLGQNKNVSAQTSLTAGEDDYQSNVYLHALRNSVYYFYSFDESINVSESTTSTPLEIKFLGKTLKITDVDNTDDGKFTAYVGTEYYLSAGQSVVVDGKTITLEGVSSSNAVLINVDGVTESIPTGGTETVNGIEITNDEAFYTSAGTEETSASLVIGSDSSDTYTDGDAYPGGDGSCDDENPSDNDCWIWYTDNLDLKTTTTVVNNVSGITMAGPYIGIKNYFNINSAGDNPLGPGECLQFPNNYISLCFDSLTTDDEDYMTVIMEYEPNADFSAAWNNTDVAPAVFTTQTNERSIYIHTDVSEGLELEYDNIDGQRQITQDTKTKEVWLSLNTTDASAVDVFYRDSNNKMRFAGTMNSTTGTFGVAAGENILRVNYQNTKGTNMELDFGSSLHEATINNFTLLWDVAGQDTDTLTVGTDDIGIVWGVGTGAKASGGNETVSLGWTANTEEAAELYWGGTGTNTTIGTKDEDHMTKYGVVIKDPKAHGASDEVVLEIPEDQVMAKIRVAATAVEDTDAGGSSTAAVSMLDTELSDMAGKNVLSIGGPAINQISAQLMGLPFPSYGADSGISENEAVIELMATGDNYAMVVAGYEAEDTRRAGIVLKNYMDFADKLVGTSVAVKGTSLEVSGITVE